MAIVYKHSKLGSEDPFYIGIGKSIKRAYNVHKRTIIWKRVVAKYGINVTILFDNLSWEDACLKEIELISLYGRLNNNTGILVNLTDGGEGSVGYKHTGEALVKISETSKGRIKSDEQIQKWKSSMNFEKSPETREKIRQTLLGKVHNEERKYKNSLSHMGKIMTDESKQRLSIATKGIKKGPLTKEHIQKLKDSHKGILQSEATKLKRKHTWELKRLAKTRIVLDN